MRDPVAESIRRKQYRGDNPLRDELGSRTPAEERELYQRNALALLFTIAFHVALVVILSLGFQAPERRLVKTAAQKEIRIRLQEVKPVEPFEEQYVEVNPNVPQNKPDETPNFSSRDQQAEQEIKAEELGPDPAIDGEMEESNKIVSGSRELPQLAELAGTDTSEGDSETDSDTADVVTLTPPTAPKALQGEVEDGEGLASWMEPGEAEERPDTEETVIALTMNPDTAARQQLEASGIKGSPISSPQPMPRPRLVVPVDTHSGPLRKSLTGLANETGRVAWDARFSEYGDYLQRMFDAIGIKWNELNNYGQSTLNELQSSVVIQFYINKEGQVEDLEVVRSTAGQAAEWRCIDAIKANSPYFPWTKDMVQILGERQPVRVTFIYR